VFDADADAWKHAADSTGVNVPGAITVVTWNVWFGERAFDERATALLDRVMACDPDVVGFQEVTAELLAHVVARDDVRDGYWISDTTGATFESYGTALLARRSLLPGALWQWQLPGSMGRTLLCAEIGALSFATVHLESRPHNAELRGEQLEEIQPLLCNRPGDAFLFGDFNFCSSWRAENRRIDPSFVDVWPALRGGAPGYTEDTAINAMLRAKEGKEKQVRFDRMLLRSPAKAWLPERIELLGTEAADDEGEIFPSDHFGLVARFHRADVPG
jgi:tyrosyl-DNA phosphodiesterase 2